MIFCRGFIPKRFLIHSFKFFLLILPLPWLPRVGAMLATFAWRGGIFATKPLIELKGMESKVHGFQCADYVWWRLAERIVTATPSGQCKHSGFVTLWIEHGLGSRIMIPTSVIRFILVGIINTAVGLSVIFASKFSGADDITANVMGYAVGLTVSFSLNKRWTFNFRGSALSSLLRFLLIFAVAYAANLGTVLGLIKLGVNSFWSQALGMAPYTVLFYLGSRLYAFPVAGAQISRTQSTEST